MDITARETLVTQEGFEKLKEELDRLVNVKREEVAERIRVAREYGDIAEGGNSEYFEAKNEQSRLEHRIMQLEERIRNARIVTETDTKTVGIGNKVIVLNIDSKKEETWWIVGSTEADPLNSRVSNESPVGSALMGCKRGDKVSITLPNGKRLRYEVKGIRKG